MRIDCPSCAATYEVPDTLLTGRKQVRCARCGQQWTPAAPKLPQETPEDTPEETAGPVRPAPAAPEPAAPPSWVASRPAPPAPRPQPPPQPRPRGLRLAWILSVLVLAAGLGAAVVWRDQVMQVWPPSLRVYAALGLGHNLR